VAVARIPPDGLMMRLTRWLFLRLLAVVACVAFSSYAVQILGLVGSHGLLPAGDYLASADAYFRTLPADAAGGRWLLPTLCWLGHGDAVLLAMAWGGAALSVVLLLGFAQGWVIVALWTLYLSLTVVGQTFLSFQWDSLLLETLLFSLFVVPWSLAPRRPSREPAPWPLGILMLRLLLFKLMFLSGVVKLLSLDDAWLRLSALEVHYYTQPLPAWTSWYAHQLPAGFQHLSVFVCLVIEILVPFLIFMPRRLRLGAAVPLLGLQLLIAATGNYGFFNLLTIVLCVPLLDDRALAHLPGLSRPLAGAPESPAPGRGGSAGPAWRALPRATLATVLIVVSALTLVREMARSYPAGAREGDLLGRALELAEGGLLSWGQPAVLAVTDPFRSINGYGLFRAMTLRRPEIVVEVSGDGATWSEVPFRWKPGDPARAPRFTGPHMPRLDWQMWFAALDPSRSMPWLARLAQALLEGEPRVLELLDEDRLPATPPRLVRFRLYDYRFTTADERSQSGDWWVRAPRGELPTRPLSRDDFAPRSADVRRDSAMARPMAACSAGRGCTGSKKSGPGGSSSAARSCGRSITSKSPEAPSSRNSA
jgi:lipase maturation factor 1